MGARAQRNDEAPGGAKEKKRKSKGGADAYRFDRAVMMRAEALVCVPWRW
jgi:hypothetical protein